MAQVRSFAGLYSNNIVVIANTRLCQTFCSRRRWSARKQALIGRDGEANLASSYTRWVTSTGMGDPGFGRAKLNGVTCRTGHGCIHQDPIVGRLRGWEEEHATWVAVECGSHAIESLLANKA